MALVLNEIEFKELADQVIDGVIPDVRPEDSITVSLYHPDTAYSWRQEFYATLDNTQAQLLAEVVRRHFGCQWCEVVTQFGTFRSEGRR